MSKPYDKPHCLMCPNEIPEDRRRLNAFTCSNECRQRWNLEKRRPKDAVMCRFCKKPSTMEDRKLYARFRRILRTQPHLIYTEEYKQFVEDQELHAKANLEPRKKFPTTPEAFAKHMSSWMGRGRRYGKRLTLI